MKLTRRSSRSDHTPRRRMRAAERAMVRAELYEQALRDISRMAVGCDGFSHTELCIVVRDLHERAIEALEPP
jgi:hypothetical protein